MLATIHGMLHYQDPMRGSRTAIETGTFTDFRAAFYAARGLAMPGG